MTKPQNTVLCFLLTLGIVLCFTTNTPAAGRGAFAGDSVGARASILGEAFVAVADDASTLRWNPAGLGLLLQPEITSSHINFFSLGGYFDYSSDSGSINEDFVGLALPNRIAPIGISILALGTPGMAQSDEGGAIISNASYAERTFTFSAGKRLEARGFALAAGWNLNRFSLSGQSHSAGFGMDGGILLETPSILPEFGLMLRGLLMDTALGENGAIIPAKTDVAMAFSPVRPLKFVGGLSRTSGDSMMQYSAGLEYSFRWLAPLNISFLAGYKTLGALENGSLESQAKSTAVGFSARISRYKLDYAYEQHSLMGDTHRVTFGLFQNSPESFHLRRGRNAYEHLDDATALRELGEVVYLSPRNEEAYHLLVLTHERMRHKAEAIRLLEKIQSLDYDYFQEHQLGQLMEDIRGQE